MATDDFWSKFRRWRRSRPFWGGLFLVLSGVELLWSSNMDLANIQIHIGPQGFLSYVLPLLLLICGALVWISPAQRAFYGIIGLLGALYSFIGLNLGGWFFGMLLGIVGGALTISWTQQKPPPGNPLQGPPGFSGPPQFGEPHDGVRHDAPGETTQAIQVAGHDDRPHENAPAVSDPSILPGFEQPRSAVPAEPASFDAASFDAASSSAASSGASSGAASSGASAQPDGDVPGQRRGLNRKALAILVVPAFVGTTFLIGSRLPASADDCPAGLPSVATTSSSPAPAASSAAAKTTIDAKPAKGATPTTPGKAGTTTSAAPAASASATATEDSGGILDGIQDVVDGVGNLLGIGDEESSTPSASPSASTSEAPAEPSAAATTTAPAGDDASPSTAATTPSKAASSAASDEDIIPCLGARQKGLVADDDGIPRSALKPGIMKVGSLTMIGASYKGVADVPTANGVIKSLQFNMDEAINKPFSLTIAEPGGGTTTIKSSELRTKTNVRFYTPKFTGNLFGVIPVTFTPEQPPPLTPPLLWFTDVTIDLAFVSCDKLTAAPLQITES